MILSGLLCVLGAATALFGGLLLTPWVPALPVLSESDVPAITLMGLGAGWAVLGAVQGARLGPGGWTKAVLLLLGGLTLVGAAGTSVWALKLSYMIPPKPGLAIDAPLPEFSATDINGNLVSNESLKGKRAVLLFFRGTW
jgi:hypothetical protein